MRGLPGYFDEYYGCEERCSSIGEIMKTFMAVLYWDEDST